VLQQIRYRVILVLALQNFHGANSPKPQLKVLPHGFPLLQEKYCDKPAEIDRVLLSATLPL
jgi:hypothetical protein